MNSLQWAQARRSKVNVDCELSRAPKRQNAKGKKQIIAASEIKILRRNGDGIVTD
jgi:hypothetical protein